MAISQEKILEIRERANIVDIISDYIPVEQRGKNYFAVCPFHDDHNPSMSISPTKQIYKCFVCGAHGNVFTFVMDYENVSFLEAVKIVASKVNIDVDIKEYVEKKHDNKNKDLIDIYDIANKFYQNNLNTQNGKEAKDYLLKREINEDVIKEFGIGLSTTNKLYAMLSSKKYSDDILLSSGIVSSNENRIFDTFTNRIMFPLWDLEGRVIGFSGRVYDRKDPSKYINSRESEIFKKGELLYNYHRAKEEARRKRSIIITEGFMDVIALFKIGIKNVIATMGTAVTSNQVSLIKKMSNNVILCFDGDAAGEKATIACSLELVKSGVIPKVVRLIDDLDPDDFIKKYGVDKFNEYLDNPKSYLDYKIEYYKKGTNFDDSESVSNYIRNVIDELGNENDKIIRELIIKNLSEETKISIITLNNLLKNKNYESKPKRTEVKKLTLGKYEKAERRLLFYMIRYDEVLKMYERNKCFFPTQDFRFLVNELLYFYKKYNRLSIADFIVFLNGKDELIEALSLIDNMNIPENYYIDEIKDYIDLLNNYGIELEIKRLNNLFKSEVDENKKIEIAKKIADLKVSV